jgi:hypothetical protein
VNNRRLSRYLFLLLLLNTSGCTFATAHQSPALIEGRDSMESYGFSVGGFFDGGKSSRDGSDFSYGLPLAFAQKRWRLNDNMEGGIRVAGVPYLGTMVGDLKYLVMDSPLLVSADLGLGFIQMRTMGLYPTVIVGSEHFYAGVQQNTIIPLSGHAREDIASGTIDPPVFESFVGAIIGEKVKFMPELRFFTDSDSDFVVAVLLGLRWDGDLLPFRRK